MFRRQQNRGVGWGLRLPVNLKPVTLICSLIMIVGVTTVARAGPGDLDPTFGDGGLVTLEVLTSTDDVGRDIITVQGDGKIVVVGLVDGNTGYDFGVARYFSDGSPDGSFGVDGTVVTDFGSTYDRASAVAVQPDDKIVVAGITNWYPCDFGLARYNVDGSLDGEFGAGGLVATDFFGSYDYANSVAVQSDGKIVVAGTTDSDPGSRRDWDFALARYNSDGTLDTSFGIGGKVISHFNTMWDEAYGAAVQSDGKILAAGRVDNDFALARYNSNGTLDASFGNNGLVRTHLNNRSVVRSIAIQADGRIVAAGDTSGPYTAGQDFALARYNSNGSLDTSFGSGGLVTTDIGSTRDQASDVAIQPDGRLVVTGYTIPDNVFLAMARYNPNGSLDYSFGSSGRVVSDVCSSGWGVAVQEQDQGPAKILIAGSVHDVITGDNFALVRFDAYGSLDGGFGDNGLVTTDFLGPARTDAWHSLLAIQPDGKIVVAGTVWMPGRGEIVVARFEPDGNLDTGFGTDGVVTTNSGRSRDYPEAMTLQSDGKIIVLGRKESGVATRWDLSLIRHNSDGSLDGGFGDGGFVTADIGEYWTGVAVQPDGKIVAVGYTTVEHFIVARYNGDGTLDTNFGSGGVVTTDFDPGNDYANAYAVVVQPDGKIVVAGLAEGPSSIDFALARYDPDGSLDSTFGSGGLVMTDFFSDDDEAFAIALQPDGQIVVAGLVATPSADYDFALARYNSDGTLDTSFGSNGLVTTDFASGYDECYGVAVLANGRIVVTGAAEMPDPAGSDFALAAYEPDGSLVESFGNGGLVTTDISTYYEFASAIALQADGRIVVAGGTGEINRSNLAVLRYEGPPNTVPGTDVVVEPFDPATQSSPVTLEFDQVMDDGETTLTTSSSGAPPPFGFKIGQPPTLYDIETTAEFSGTIDICIDYSNIAYGNEANLKLFHYDDTDGDEIPDAWVDVTSSLDMESDVICGTVEHLSAFAVFEALDTDDDGLTDLDELVLGTDPADDDTDDDGAFDGTEVEMAAGSGCPDPLDPDSDDDYLLDGAEISIGTNPCNPDSDDDGVPDDIDPDPLLRGEFNDVLEEATRNLAIAIWDLGPAPFNGPNENANKGRRTALSNRATNAANDIADDDYAGAIEYLDSLLAKIDGETSPPDWIDDPDVKWELATDVVQLLDLLSQ